MLIDSVGIFFDYFFFTVFYCQFKCQKSHHSNVSKECLYLQKAYILPTKTLINNCVLHKFFHLDTPTLLKILDLCLLTLVPRINRPGYVWFFSNLPTVIPDPLIFPIFSNLSVYSNLILFLFQNQFWLNFPISPFIPTNPYMQNLSVQGYSSWLNSQVNWSAYIVLQ